MGQSCVPYNVPHCFFSLTSGRTRSGLVSVPPFTDGRSPFTLSHNGASRYQVLCVSRRLRDKNPSHNKQEHSSNLISGISHSGTARTGLMLCYIWLKSSEIAIKVAKEIRDEIEKFAQQHGLIMFGRFS